MLLQLLPDPPATMVLFNITFTHIPATHPVPLPLSWAAQIQQLIHDGLNMPPSLHALDKATCTTALINEVTFDMPGRRIRVTWADGTWEDSVLEEGRCFEMLRGIVSDVNASKAQGESDEMRRRGKVHSPVHKKPVKHKKQRSLIMTLLSSLVPSTLTSSIASQRPPPPIPSPPLPRDTTLTHPHLSARFLRHRARSTLVDVYRAHVLPGLAIHTLRAHTRSSTSNSESSSASEFGDESEFGSDHVQGYGYGYGYGYMAWAAHSALRRALSHMDLLFAQSVPSPSSGLDGLSLPDLIFSRMRGRGQDGDEAGECVSMADTNTDTDGSSIHTPRNSIIDYPTSNRSSKLSTRSPTLQSGSSSTTSPRSSSFAQEPQFSASALAQYTQLSNECTHLRHLLSNLAHLGSRAASERMEFEAVLEVRSKRRAWSNKAYKGGASADVGCVGLGVVRMSSPLVRCEPICADNVSVLQVEEMVEEPRLGFPASEMTEDALRGTLEAGPVQAQLMPRRPFTPAPDVRPRARSIHRLQALHLQSTAESELPVLLSRPSPNVEVSVAVDVGVAVDGLVMDVPLLCQPFVPKNHDFQLETETKARFYFDFDDDDDDDDEEDDGDEQEENADLRAFALSLDDGLQRSAGYEHMFQGAAIECH